MYCITQNIYISTRVKICIHSTLIQFLYHVSMSLLTNPCYLLGANDIKNFAISKNGMGIEVNKLCKQVRDQRNSAQVLLENENKLIYSNI